MKHTMVRERSLTDGGSPFRPKGSECDWVITKFCNCLRTIPRQFLYLQPIRGFFKESPEEFLSNVAEYGMTESLLRLERWLGLVGATGVLNRVFTSLYENERVPVLQYSKDGARYCICEDPADVAKIAVLYAADCPTNYGMRHLDANQFDDARCIRWAKEIPNSSS
jgi:hypothetical protein